MVFGQREKEETGKVFWIPWKGDQLSRLILICRKFDRVWLSHRTTSFHRPLGPAQLRTTELGTCESKKSPRVSNVNQNRVTSYSEMDLAGERRGDFGKRTEPFD